MGRQVLEGVSRDRDGIVVGSHPRPVKLQALAGFARLREVHLLGRTVLLEALFDPALEGTQRQAGAGRLVLTGAQ